MFENASSAASSFVKGLIARTSSSKVQSRHKWAPTKTNNSSSSPFLENFGARTFSEVAPRRPFDQFAGAPTKNLRLSVNHMSFHTCIDIHLKQQPKPPRAQAAQKHAASPTCASKSTVYYATVHRTPQSTALRALLTTSPYKNTAIYDTAASFLHGFTQPANTRNA